MIKPHLFLFSLITIYVFISPEFSLSLGPFSRFLSYFSSVVWLKQLFPYLPSPASFPATRPWQNNWPLYRRMTVAEDALWGLQEAGRRLEWYVEDFLEQIDLAPFPPAPARKYWISPAHPRPRTSTYCPILALTACPNPSTPWSSGALPVSSVLILAHRPWWIQASCHQCLSEAGRRSRVIAARGETKSTAYGRITAPCPRLSQAGCRSRLISARRPWGNQGHRPWLSPAGLSCAPGLAGGVWVGVGARSSTAPPRAPPSFRASRAPPSVCASRAPSSACFSQVCSSARSSQIRSSAHSSQVRSSARSSRAPTRP